MLGWMLPGFSFFFLFLSQWSWQTLPWISCAPAHLAGYDKKARECPFPGFHRFALAASNFEAGFPAAINQQVPQVQCSFPVMQLTAQTGCCQGLSEPPLWELGLTEAIVKGFWFFEMEFSLWPKGKRPFSTPSLFLEHFLEKTGICISFF